MFEPDLKFRYSPEKLHQLELSYYVAALRIENGFILAQLSGIQKHFLKTKQLSINYIKKQL